MRRRIVSVCIVLLAGLILATFISERFSGHNADSGDLDTAAVAYQSAGLPWEATDLDPSPPISNQEDATPSLMAALAKFDDSAVKRRLGLARTAVEARDSNGLKELLVPYVRALAAAELAAEHSRAFFRGDRDHFPLLFHEYSNLRYVSVLFGYTAEFYALRHDSADCLFNLRTGFQISAFLEQQPDPEALDFETSADISLFRLCTDCAAEFVHDPKTLLELSRIVKSAATRPDPIRHLRAAIYPGVALLRNVEYYGGADVLRKKLADGEGAYGTPAHTAEFERIGFPRTAKDRGAMDDYLRFWLSVLPNQLKEQGDPVRAERDLRRAADAWSASRDKGYLDRLLLPTSRRGSSFGYDPGAGMLIAGDWTRRVTVDALVEGLIIYAKTGKMPTALGDIPGTWKDPMSPARGLHLKSGRDTLRIYSTGVSAKDHGGVDILEVSSENLSAGDYDLAAGYPPVRVRVLQRQPSP